MRLWPTKHYILRLAAVVVVQQTNGQEETVFRLVVPAGTEEHSRDELLRAYRLGMSHMAAACDVELTPTKEGVRVTPKAVVMAANII